MPSKNRLVCYFGCPNNGPLHHFPNPKTIQYNLDGIEKFAAWKAVLSEETKEKGDTYIFNIVRFCNKHFAKGFVFPNGRLTKNAVPTLNLEKKTPGGIEEEFLEYEVLEDYEELLTDVYTSDHTEQHHVTSKQLPTSKFVATRQRSTPYILNTTFLPFKSDISTAEPSIAELSTAEPSTAEPSTAEPSTADSLPAEPLRAESSKFNHLTASHTLDVEQHHVPSKQLSTSEIVATCQRSTPYILNTTFLPFKSDFSTAEPSIVQLSTAEPLPAEPLRAEPSKFHPSTASHSLKHTFDVGYRKHYRAVDPNAVLVKKLKRKLEKLTIKYKNQRKQLLACRKVSMSLMKKMTIMDRLPEDVRTFTKLQLKGDLKPKGRRFTNEEKTMALTILKESPKAFRLLRSMFVLPSKRVLQSTQQKSQNVSL